MTLAPDVSHPRNTNVSLIVDCVCLCFFFFLIWQTGAPVSERDEMGHVDIEQPVREVLLCSEVSGGEEGLSSAIQPGPSGATKQKCLLHYY